MFFILINLLICFSINYNIAKIRFWSDGKRDVELRQGPITANVRLDLLMRENLGTGESLFSRVENPAD